MLNHPKNKPRPPRRRADLDVYHWRERFKRSTFVIKWEEYANRVRVEGVIQQCKNAAFRFVPGKRVEFLVNPFGDIRVTITNRPKKGAHGARRAA